MLHNNSTEQARVWARGESIEGFLQETLPTTEVEDGLKMLHARDD